MLLIEFMHAYMRMAINTWSKISHWMAVEAYFF